jgi:hypothetical protein
MADCALLTDCDGVDLSGLTRRYSAAARTPVQSDRAQAVGWPAVPDRGAPRPVYTSPPAATPTSGPPGPFRQFEYLHCAGKVGHIVSDAGFARSVELLDVGVQAMGGSDGGTARHALWPADVVTTSSGIPSDARISHQMGGDIGVDRSVHLDCAMTLVAGVRATTRRTSPQVATISHPGRIAAASVSGRAPAMSPPASAIPTAAPTWNRSCHPNPTRSRA